MPSDERNSDASGRGTPSGPPGDADDQAEPRLLAQLYPASQPTLRGALQQILSAGRPLPDFGQAVQILRGI